MALKSVADRASIAASGAAAGDQIVITGKNETWEVVDNKLKVPTSTLCVKLANGNFAALSVKETVARNEPRQFQRFQIPPTMLQGRWYALTVICTWLKTQ